MHFESLLMALKKHLGLAFVLFEVGAALGVVLIYLCLNSEHGSMLPPSSLMILFTKLPFVDS